MPDHDNWRSVISRRQTLALTGAVGVATVAGCFGDDGDDAEDLLGPELEERVEAVDYNENYEDEFHQVVPGNDENAYDGEYIFNPFHTSWNQGDVQETSFEYLAVFHAEDGFIPRIAEDWDHDQDAGVTTVEISDDYSWSDGEPITAQDFVTQYKMDIYMEEPISDYVAPDGVRVVDDHTFEIEPRDEYVDLEQELWFNQWIEALLTINHDDYGDFVEQFEDIDIDDEDELTSVQQDVVNFEPEWNHTRFSGPFVWVEANEQFADRVPNPEHPIARDWEFYFRTGEYIEEEGMRAEEVDFVHQMSDLQDLPDIYEEAPVSYSGQSFALLFGPQDEYIASDPQVRQAIAYAVDFETLVAEVAPGTPVDEYQTGIDFGYVEQFVDADVLDSMTSYAAEDLDTATELLEGAGFSLDDGTWYTPDDEAWQLEFPVGDWFETSSEMISNNLQEFGIDIDHYVDEMSTWNAEVGDDTNYDISVHLNYGLSREYHAHSDLSQEFFGGDRGAVSELGLFEAEVEIPEVGDPDGDTITMNLEEELEALAVAPDEDTVIEHSTNLAWAHNQLLPGAPLHPWSEHYWVNTSDWDFDIDSSAWLTSNRIYHYFLEHGLSPQ